MFVYASDTRVTNFTHWPPHRDVADSVAHIRRCLDGYASGLPSPWGVELGGHIVGTAGFISWTVPDQRADIGYVISPLVSNRGVATEAARLFLDYAFKHTGLNRAQGHCSVGNIASSRVLEKLGFVHEGVLRDYMVVRGQARDFNAYGLLAGEWLQSASDVR